MTASPQASSSGGFFRPATDTTWDVVSLGEVMLRFDPGERRIHTTRSFEVSEGGGEYNVARGLRRAFGYRAAVLTALVDNPLGRLVEDLMLQGGVDVSQMIYRQDGGAGRTFRNGLNFVERGFGPRPALGCSDRGHTAIAALAPGDFDFDAVFARGARLFHTGGIFAALGARTADVARDAVVSARRRGARVSYDLNYRPSLWADLGGSARAREVNRGLVGEVDVLFGNEEDFSVALGFETEGFSAERLDVTAYEAMVRRVARAFPNLGFVGTSLRVAHTASENAWGGLLYDARADLFEYVEPRPIAILDRVGGGDSFASGVLAGLLGGRAARACLELGVAHGALAMSTPGDTSMVTEREIERLARGDGARIER